MRLERTVSWSQTRRDTNFAIPGYSLFCHDTTARGKNKDFSVCGHSCGQNRFCAGFGDQRKTSKRRRCKALRRFASPYPGYRHGTPKASALPTALIPDLGFEFCARCGQTCGQAVFLTISACGGSACIAGISRDCGHGIFRLEGGATRSQTRRDTNFAIPGYSISAMIPRRAGKIKLFLSVVIYVVKAAFVPFSAIGISPANAGLHSRSPAIIPPARRGCKDYLWCADRFSASLARMPFMASCS